MRYRTLKRIIDTLDEASSPGAAKNVYDVYALGPKEKEKEAEALLVSLCTKLAFRATLAKIPTIKPRVAPGATRRVGRVSPSGQVGRPALPPVAKNLSTTASGAVVNPRRSIRQAMTAGTTMGSF